MAEGIGELELSGPLSGVPGITSSQRIHHVLALDADLDAVERRYRPSVRRNIRKGREVGLRTRRATSEGDMMDVFYPLQVTTRRRLGLPPQPRRFFRAIWRYVLSAGLGHLTIVEAAGRPVAAGVFLEWKQVTIYKYGASDPSAWHLRPNNVLFADEIAAACGRGSRIFHLGRTDLADEGLRRFKLGWGADEEPVRSSWFGAAPRSERSGPPELLRTLVRRSPAILARTVGETLYRYVA
jgi:lipid II:glycine glycyltransferase (peptidoglycan interpeptide bridge formation enzyme)